MESNTFAIIEIGGRQELVTPNGKLVVNRVSHKEGASFEVDEVVLFVEGEKVEIGQPYVNKKVVLKVIEHKKAPKINVIKFKAKSRYRRKRGHRQPISVLKVEKIGGTKPKAGKKTKAEKKPEKKKSEKKEKYVCPKCGKKYKMKHYYDKHVEKCEG